MRDSSTIRSGHATKALLAATLDFVRHRLSGPEWHRLRAALPREAAITRALPSRPLAVLRWLDEVIDRANPDTRNVCAALIEAAPELAWGQTYSAADFGPAFLQRYGWSELVGQRGPVASDSLACGFLMLGPETLYPRHRHEAEEVYMTMSGTAEWLKADAPFVPVPPGALVHHPPWCWHAMRTREQPLLALYLWIGGDLTRKSEIEPAG